MGLKERWEATVADVADLAIKAGRRPEDVKIVAVSKTVGPEVVKEALQYGITDYGENREKPFNEKLALFPQANWHFIGTLQSNKAKQVVGKACLIHSLDRESLLKAIQKEASKLGIIQDVLVEVSDGEESKGGIAPAELPAFLEKLAACENIRCRGLMGMAPRGNLKTARETFSGLRELTVDMAERFGSRDNIEMTELSMGMSEDYPAAIAEGATIVRIGRRIFSDTFDPSL